MKIKKIYLTLIAVVIAFSSVLLAGCSGSSGTTNTPTEKWITLANKSKNEEMWIDIYATKYNGKDETQIDNLNYYENIKVNKYSSESEKALKENTLQFDTYERFGFTFGVNAIVKIKFDVVSEQDQEFEFDFIYIDDQTKKWVTVNQTITTQANKPFTVILDVKDFEGVTNASAVEVRLKNIPMVEDIFHQQTWYNTNIKWTIQNVAFINK